ncbi:unnamed protein product [Boreogadus saida]
MLSLSADREAYGPEEAARWLAVSRFFQRHPPAMPADNRFGRPAYGVGYHDSKGHMALPHCGAGTRAASLVQGPLAPDGLFGPRFSEVLAHQQSVRENRSRFGAILTAGSRGPPPTPAPVPQQQPQQTEAASLGASWTDQRLVARARGYGRLYWSPSSPHYSVEAVGAEEYGLFLDVFLSCGLALSPTAMRVGKSDSSGGLLGRHKLRVLLVSRSVSPDLEYWKRPSALLRGVRRVASYVVVFTDASLTGWGGTCLSHSVGDEWRTPPTAHINVLELDAVRKVLLHLFSPELVNVAREREVWGPLLELLPPRPDPG